MNSKHYDLVVLGGGSAGLKAAKTAIKLGKRVAVVEARELGGECFWAGCVPTKALIRAAEVWNLVKRAAEFGIDAPVRNASFAQAMAFKERAVRQVGGEAQAQEVAERTGYDLFPTRARFISDAEIEVDGQVVSADKILLAVGTDPLVPDIPGLSESGFLTNRDAVNLRDLPERMAVLGGGPIGLEFAQAFQRFGARVTVIERGPQVLPKEDHEIADLAGKLLAGEGIELACNAELKAVEGRRLMLAHYGREDWREFDALLVAVGRRAAVDGLNLETAGVKMSGHFVEVDAFFQTSNPRVWAAGDCAGGYLFTHVASHEGGLVAHNMFSPVPKAYELSVVPRATFIDPELGSVGLTENEARERYADVEIRKFDLAHLDRALLHGEAKGLVKLVTEPRSRTLLGGHVLAPGASSILAELTLAMNHNIPVEGISSTMHAYPTFPEAIESAALSEPV